VYSWDDYWFQTDYTWYRKPYDDGDYTTGRSRMDSFLKAKRINNATIPIMCIEFGWKTSDHVEACADWYELLNAYTNEWTTWMWWGNPPNYGLATDFTYSDLTAHGDAMVANLNTGTRTGTIDVTTVNAAGSIYVDEVDTGDDGAHNATYSVGTHTVSYGAMTGFTTPDPESQLLTDGGTSTYTGTYVALVPPPPTPGTLLVYTKDASGLLVQGAIWIDGVDTTETGTYSNEYTGGTSKTVSFGALTDYLTPASQVKEIIEDETVTVTGTYLIDEEAEVYSGDRGCNSWSGW
jgi:hypothetical protein